MRLFLTLLLAIILTLFMAAGLALLLRHDPGYVLLSIDQWTLETSVAVLVLFLIVAFVALYVLLRVLIGLLQAPRKALQANRRRQVSRSARLLNRGYKELVEGRWKKAEITLLKGAEHSATPSLHYLGAARAAQHLKEIWRRDSYLRKAEDASGPDVLANRLMRAELLLEYQEPANARDVLLPLRKGDQVHQPRLLELLARCHQSLGEWDKLRELLPMLKKYGVMGDSALTELMTKSYADLLTHVAHTGTVSDLQALWNEMPATLHADEGLLLSYAGHLQYLNAADEAETLLRTALNKNWSDKLVVGYGEISRGNRAARLAVAEGWLNDRPQDGYLLLTCGRLARRNRQMDKARGYLEHSLKMLVTPDAYQELGEVMDEAGDKESARQCYRAALNLLTGRMTDKEGVAELAGEGPDKLPGAGQPSLTKEDPPQPSLTQNPEPSES
ncbi:MAG: hypothetical protein H6971_06790 [Gammaproteobacteria bacterium]|nr:hypothetical protein [Gammaproteobacteria bacterium]